MTWPGLAGAMLAAEADAEAAGFALAPALAAPEAAGLALAAVLAAAAGFALVAALAGAAGALEAGAVAPPHAVSKPSDIKMTELRKRCNTRMSFLTQSSR